MEEQVFTKEEFQAQLMSAKSPEELIEFAKVYDAELSPENAQKLFDSMHAEGELSDDELEGVSGGSWLTDVFKSIDKFFTEDVKDFFTKDIPEYFEGFADFTKSLAQVSTSAAVSSMTKKD